ncbi:uncharacterized protein LOC108914292 isoform X2 [Anoplophora glabripennis]|uniref:uncharacterized protein LOC108914292 isoform X2 n=1 Tax=Anoplophora glabripennis TaxID=217634 RepID=UPI000873A271|nr:uncharacterized protein LOC108914292 isoform X2 [Anoplophora glabripennis]
MCQNIFRQCYQLHRSKFSIKVFLKKFHMRRVIGDTPLCFEEFCTVLAQIESCLNSRPLYALSSDANDPSPLTPSHFLIGETLTSIPEPDYTDRANNQLKRFQLLQKMFQSFWSRWNQEYISQLQTRAKWKDTYSDQLKPNVLVLVKGDGLPPLKWLIGRVIQVFPGPDGVIRTATIKTLHGIYKRPAVKLCILPLPPDPDERS